MRAEKKKNQVAAYNAEGKKWAVHILFNQKRVVCDSIQAGI